ncbi:MAG TPA: hypothetical protein VGS80_26710 [Ktedonobacterales bacterium]|nr:hypothetical protein [Ktedonobacterales bacterium]
MNWPPPKALLGQRAGGRTVDCQEAGQPAEVLACVLGILGASGLLGALPYAEELIRCLCADPSLAPTPAATDEPAGNLRVEPAAQAS